MSAAVEVQIPEAPRAYDESKDRANALRRLITPDGLKNQVVTFLSERAGLPLSREFNLTLSDGQLFSEDFPNLPLEELYAKPAYDPIFDRRSPSDSAYIRQIQDWANENPNEDFHWVQISPTTKINDGEFVRQLSSETVFEIGEMAFDLDGNRNATIRRLASPFIDGESVEEVFERLKVVGDLLQPGEFVDVQDERDFLTRPVFRSGNLDLNSIISNIDTFLAESAGVKFYKGQPVSEKSLGKIKDIDERFNHALNILEPELQKYILACFDPETRLHELNLYVKSLVNQFDRLFDGEAVNDIGNTDFWGKQEVKLVASGCGGFGGGLSMGTVMRLPSTGFGGEDKYGKLEFECPNKLCKAINRRPMNQLIETCQACRQSVRC